jgi:hypothetical protein
MYQAVGGDVSFRLKPYLDKWGARVGIRAAKLQWFARTGTLIAGGNGLVLGLIAVVIGVENKVNWIVLLGRGLLVLGAIVALTGMVCIRLSVSAMSKHFGRHLTLRTSPLLGDAQFQLWCEKQGLPCPPSTRS